MSAALRSVLAQPRCTIRRLDARYRVPASRRGERGRLDRIISSALDEVLEPALERVGVAPSEEVCIRAIAIIARIRLDARDDDLALAWSLAVADAIAREIASGGPNVVRYGSRPHALMDLVSSASRGDPTRAWAWRQLGLTSGETFDSREALVASAMRALAEEGAAAVAVMREVARLGKLPAILTAATPMQWLMIEAAVADSFGVERSIASIGRAIDTEAVDWAVARDWDGMRIERVVGRSVVVRAVEGLVAPSTTTTRALAMLAALEVSPEIATEQPDRVARVVASVMQAIQERYYNSSNIKTNIPSHRDAAASRPGLVAPLVDRPSTSRGSGDERRRSETDARTDSSVVEPTTRVPTTAEHANSEAATPSVAGDEPLEVVRQRDRTQWGGLLFLLHIVRETDLAIRLLDDPILQARLLAWSLHQLALSLIPVEATDPAALAFCGLRPSDDPPGADEPRATPEERTAIDGYRAMIVQALCDRLGGDDSPELVLASMTRRRAEIVADPGWIEARFTLEDVSVPVRRAGLDLDLDWLPWLGVVVRFAYV